jgi:sulfonate transport system permease protein
MPAFHLIMPRLIFHITITVGEITMAENLAAVAAGARENSLPAARMGARGVVPIRLPRGLIPWLGPLMLLVAWELAARFGGLSPHILPAPTKVAATAVKLIQNGQLIPDMGISLLRAAIGFAIGGSVGFTLGIVVGFSRLAETLLDRTIQMLRAIPFLAALPLVIVWLGIGEGAKIFLVALGVTFPIYINTVLGIRQVDPKLLELGRVRGLSSLQMVRRIILPGALPSILTGVRYALATAWLALVVAETIAASSGIGFLAMDAREFLRTDVIVLAIVIYAGIGVTADAIARLLERRLLAWHPNYAREPRS